MVSLNFCVRPIVFFSRTHERNLADLISRTRRARFSTQEPNVARRLPKRLLLCRCGGRSYVYRLSVACCLSQAGDRSFFPVSRTNSQRARRQQRGPIWLEIAPVDGRFNLSYFRRYETIARLLSPPRLSWSDGVRSSRWWRRRSFREDREGRGGVGEKNYCFQKPASKTPTSPTHIHIHLLIRARPRQPRSWANFAAVGKGLLQAPEKVLAIFRQGSIPQPPQLPGARSHNDEVEELTMRRASYEVTPTAFVPVFGICKACRIRRTDMCLWDVKWHGMAYITRRMCRVDVVIISLFGDENSRTRRIFCERDVGTQALLRGRLINSRLIVADEQCIAGSIEKLFSYWRG